MEVAVLCWGQFNGENKPFRFHLFIARRKGSDTPTPPQSCKPLSFDLHPPVVLHDWQWDSGWGGGRARRQAAPERQTSGRLRQPYHTGGSSQKAINHATQNARVSSDNRLHQWSKFPSPLSPFKVTTVTLACFQSIKRCSYLIMELTRFLYLKT